MARTKKPSKAAMDAAKAMLQPCAEMQAVAATLADMNKQLDQMNDTIQRLVKSIEGSKAGSNLLTEPSPSPTAGPLNG